MNDPTIDTTEFLLKFVRPRPGMFLTSPNLLYLHIFLTGYNIAFRQNCLDKEDRFFNHFDDWFFQSNKFEFRSNWYAEILEKCDDSQEKALQRFWEYLSEFDKQVPRLEQLTS